VALYLVQHGKNLSRDIDPEQGLSEEGVAQVTRVAETARHYHVLVGAIAHSGKKRARQTAEIFSDHLGVKQIDAVKGLQPLDDVAEKAGSLHTGQNLMLVGHLPFMERLTAYLTTGSTEYTVFKFQNGGIVCLDALPDSTRWTIKWALMPKVG